MRSTSAIILDGLWKCLCPTFGLNLGQVTRPLGLSARPLGARRRAARELLSNPSTKRFFTQSVLRCQEQLLANSAPVDSTIPAADPTPDGRRADTASFANSDENLYETLYTAASNGQLGDVDRLVGHLHLERRHPLNARMYDARILANINVYRGSAAKVATLLKEMKDEGIHPDASTYHHVLEVGQLNIRKRSSY